MMDLSSTMYRRLSRYLCNKSFIIGVLFAYVTVAVFITISGRAGPHRADSRDLRNERFDVSRELTEKMLVLADTTIADTERVQEVEQTGLDIATANQSLVYEDKQQVRPSNQRVVYADQDQVRHEVHKGQVNGRTSDQGVVYGDQDQERTSGHRVEHEDQDQVRTRDQRGVNSDQDQVKSSNQSIDEGVELLHSMKPTFRCKGDNITREEKQSLDCQRRLPQVLGIGIEKCGTGALSFFLEMHPNIAHSYPKELYYWNKHRGQSLEWYQNIMPISSKYQLSMEYTPSYIFGRDIPYRIYRWFPDMKFIVMLREPIERAVSFFLHMQHFERIWPGLHEARKHDPEAVAHAFLNDTFESTVMTPDGRVFEDNAVIENALYEVHLRRWFEVFPREQFLIVDEGVFRKDPVVVLQEVEEFLGVSKFFDDTQIYFDRSRGLFCRNSADKQCMNKLKGRPHPTIRDEVREKLAAYFKPYNERLEKLLGRKFSWT